jgi:hypothetical protein
LCPRIWNYWLKNCLYLERPSGIIGKLYSITYCTQGNLM